MRLAKRLIREPLVHFLIGGGLLFAFYIGLNGADVIGRDDDRTIVVDEPALLKSMQYQSAAFEPEYFAAQYAALSASERQTLIDRYVGEEALVREARAMRLDQIDYVIRQRLVQKMTYLIDDAATASLNPGEAAVQRYFQQHRDEYRSAPTITFTHVFVDNEASHPEGGLRAARKLKDVLEARHAGFDDAPAFGDRFPYLQNYVQRAPDFIANQFGPGFAAALARLQPSRHWQGPIQSTYGYHLVLMTEHAPASVVRLADVRAQVKDDLLAAAVADYRRKAIEDLTRRYRVKLKDLPVAPTRH